MDHVICPTVPPILSHLAIPSTDMQLTDNVWQCSNDFAEMGKKMKPRVTVAFSKQADFN